MYDDTLSLIIPINLFIPLLYSFKKYVCIFLALLSLLPRQLSSSRGEKGLLFLAVCELLRAVASLVEQRF